MSKPFEEGTLIKVREFMSQEAFVCRVGGYSNTIGGATMELDDHPHLGGMGLSHVKYDCRPANPMDWPGKKVRW